VRLREVGVQTSTFLCVISMGVGEMVKNHLRGGSHQPLPKVRASSELGFERCPELEANLRLEGHEPHLRSYQLSEASHHYRSGSRHSEYRRMRPHKSGGVREGGLSPPSTRSMTPTLL
jgi:hypothetical protein